MSQFHAARPPVSECPGTRNELAVLGDNDHTYAELKKRFDKGCTVVDGNLEITYTPQGRKHTHRKLIHRMNLLINEKDDKYSFKWFAENSSKTTRRMQLVENSPSKLKGGKVVENYLVEH